MHPSRPTSPDPNAPYRAAIAALGGYPVNVQEDDALGYAAPAQYPQDAQYPQEGLPARRHVNRDRLNQIAHHLGSGVQIALEMMTLDQAHPENDVGPSNAATATGQVAANPQISARDIQQYLRAMGYADITMADQTLRIRLESANVSAETILRSLEILHDPNHPLLTHLGIRNNKRLKLIDKFIGFASRTQGFRVEIRSAMQGANDNPEQLIANLMPFARTH